MIPLIQKTLGAPYDFLKYATPNSGKSRADKVIFFAFAPGAMEPSLCIKTTRSYEASEVIRLGFRNLQKLNALTGVSAETSLFPRAVSLYDDGEHIFSVETAVPGQRERLTPEMLERVVREYTRFQAQVAQPKLQPVDAFAQELLSEELLRYYHTLPKSALRLPRVLQLGDLTEDNLHFFPGGVAIVDFDRAGEFDLPGFDLVGLLRRYSKKEVRLLSQRYLPEYLRAIGAQGEGPYDRLLFLCHAAERLLRKGSGESAEALIRGFENL